MKLYLAGPMRGYPQFNYPAFTAAAAMLRSEGHVVFNPAENDVNTGNKADAGFADGDLAKAAAGGFSLRRALGDDLAWICAEADGIALLPGWQKSKGANAEHATAVALSLYIREL